MDYLRRLYPGLTDTPAAARLDVAPAFGMRTAAADPRPEVPAVQAVGNRLVDAPTASRSSPRSMDMPVPDPRPAIDAAPALPTTTSEPEPKPRPPDRAVAREMRSSPAPSAPRQRGRTPAPPSRVNERAAAPSATVAPRIAALPARPWAVATPLAFAPLRIATVQQAGVERDRGAEPAPIVHVTIDRIDVRLPSALPAPAAPARRRPASAVGGLRDYLRGRPPEGGP